MRVLSKIAGGLVAMLIASSASAQERVFWDRFDMPAGWTENRDGYDPVERVLAMNILPQDMDRIFDKALEDAERCLPQKPWLDPLGGLMTIPFKGQKCSAVTADLMS